MNMNWAYLRTTLLQIPALSSRIYRSWKVFETRKMLCVALRTTRISPVHSNGVINYVFAVRLFRTVLRDRLKNFPGTTAMVGGAHH